MEPNWHYHIIYFLLINIISEKIECTNTHIQQLTSSAQMSSNTCGVCLEECGEKNVAITECGHITHLKCFTQVLSTSDNCIYCRRTLNIRNAEKIKKHDDPFIERHSMWIVNNDRPFHKKVEETLIVIITIILYSLLFYKLIMWFFSKTISYWKKCLQRLLYGCRRLSWHLCF